MRLERIEKDESDILKLFACHTAKVDPYPSHQSLALIFMKYSFRIAGEVFLFRNQYLLNVLAKNPINFFTINDRKI